MKLSDDLSYEELLQRLSIDLPTVLPGFVPSSLGGSSGSISQPSSNSILIWDPSQQLYVPAAFDSSLLGGFFTAYTPSVSASSGTITAAAANGNWMKLNASAILIRVQVDFNNVGTASGDIILSLPSGFNPTVTTPGIARETAVTGHPAFCYCANTSGIHIYPTTLDGGSSTWVNGYSWALVLTIPGLWS